jgi:heavy metal sensor kinase
MPLPIRVRLALVCGALVAALIVALGALVYVRLEADLLQAVDDGLATRAQSLVVDEGASPGADDPVHPGGSVLTTAPSDVGDIFAQVLARDGRIVAATPGFPANALLTPDETAALVGTRSFYVSVPSDEGPDLARVLALPGPDGQVMVVGVSFSDQQETLGRLLVELALAVPIGFGLAGVVGWLVAGAALRPVERMRAESEAVSASEPGRRLPVPQTRDELESLGKSLNRMLDRLESAAEAERRFVDDASHELRTPLANLKAELDLALRRARTQPELESALSSAAEETDRLTRLADDLLVLARASGRRLPVRREQVDLGQLVRQTVDGFKSRASTLGIGLDVSIEGEVQARVDPERIRQTIGNLVDNAIRHSARGGRVTIDLRRSDSAVEISVADSGEGFPRSFLPRAFEAFTRAGASRSRAGGGSGLGLAIVRAAAEAHGGSVEASNRQEGGALVRVRIPA